MSRLQAATGTAPINMVGPDGSHVQVPANRVDEMRSKNFAITPQPGVQRMASPQGQLTYALPDEVDKFKASGHVPIEDSGNFTVMPLPGEDNTETMARAATIAKNLPPDVMKQAIAAEAKTITAKRLAANLIGGPIAAGIVLPAAMAGTGELVASAPAATSTVLRFIGTRGAQAVLPGLEEEAGKAALKQGAKWAAKKYLIGEGLSRITTHKSLISNIMELF
jgi:hypothetical protein